MPYGGKQSGFTILETLIGMGIFAIVSTALYFTYSNVLQIVQASQYNSAALNIIESQVEIARNMRYEDLGTVGGVPAGKLLQEQTMTVDTTPFTLHTYVRSIDDPFDGTLGGTPNDTAPSDYKLIELQVTCDTCTRYNVIRMTTYVAPKNLESTSKNGNLFIRVFDADGQAVTGATVHVTNTAVTPQINLTDTTNTDGMLQLVGVATSSAGYHIVVTKNGYTTSQTYHPGSPPNPLQPDATVATQQLTITSLSIDKTSTAMWRVQDNLCRAIPGFDFLVTSTRLIGTNPNTPKYSVTQTSDAAGLVTNTTMEWGTYGINPTDTAFDIAGAAASLSFTIDPEETQSTTWLVASKSGSALLVSVVDGNGQPLNDATVEVSAAAFSATAVTGRSALPQTDWSGGRYDSVSPHMNTDGTPGTLTLADVGGTYATGSEQWLISRTFDMGTAGTTFYDLTFNPEHQPSQTTLRFQVAANNDNATWNWVGPDGTPDTYFDDPGESIPSSLSGNRFVRYKVFMETAHTTVTPIITDVAIGFRSDCGIPGQAYLNGLSGGTYTLTVSHSGFQNYSAPVIISNTWQNLTVTLQP